MVLGAILVLALALTACALDAEQEPIRFGDTQFQTLWINNAIAGFIVEHGYGYPVETVEVSTPVYQESLANGDLDIQMELWRMNLMEWYERETEAGTVIDLGPVYEQSAQGWYVPRYVIEGDAERGIEPLAPDLKSVFDLPQYKHLFQDPDNPDKGIFTNCITGWQCAVMNRAKIHAYGLDQHFTIQEPGAAAALDAAIAGAFQRGEPFFSYYWEPTWLVGTYDLVMLEEPKFNEACDEEIQQVIEGDLAPEDVTETAGCAYETYAIHKGVHAGLQDRAPEVVEFLEKMLVGTQPLSETAAYMEESGASEDEAAIWYFENFQDRWRQWVPADVEQKVEEALREAGAQL